MPPRAAASRKFMVTDDMIKSRDWHRKQVPAFRTEETAKVFFGMSVSWLRRLLRPGKKDHPETWFVGNDGKRMEFRRSGGKNAAARVFWLSDIEPMAYSLYDEGAIDAPRLARVLQVVQAIAYLYGLFDELDLPAEPAAAGA